MKLNKQTLSSMRRANECLELARLVPQRAAFWLFEASLAARRAADLHHARQKRSARSVH